MPVTEIATPPPPPVVKAKVEPVKPAPPVEIKLNPKQPHIFVQQKVLQPKIEKVEAKAPELTPTPVIQSQIVDQSNQPKRPREEVKMAMDTGSAATPTIKADPKNVQTGGFGDPNGLPGKGDPNKTTNVNRAGLQALPGGPGYGNGTGGDKGARGVVASSGFGNGTAVQDGGGRSTRYRRADLRIRPWRTTRRSRRQWNRERLPSSCWRSRNRFTRKKAAA